MLFAEIAIYVILLSMLGVALVQYYMDGNRLHLGDGTPFLGRIRPEYKEILEQHFDYYKRLSSKDKIRFEARVQTFIDNKQFLPRNLPEVTAEMKALISACAIQLSFGLPPIILQHFQRIVVYPDNYYSAINKQYHRGEVNPHMGIIVLSWRGFVEGYIDPTDSMNLGLHEMAHALHFENKILNGEEDFLEPRLLERWNQLASREIEKMHSGVPGFFRQYAASNEMEFFAVAIENFFEKPLAMQEMLPDVYSCLSEMLKQNPVSDLERV